MRGKLIKLYEEDQDILEDVLIEIHQAIEMCNIYSNILSGTMDAFASVISNNLNIVMKILTVITIVNPEYHFQFLWHECQRIALSGMVVPDSHCSCVLYHRNSYLQEKGYVSLTEHHVLFFLYFRTMYVTIYKTRR